MHRKLHKNPPGRPGSAPNSFANSGRAGVPLLSSLFTQALSRHQAGQLGDAEALYRQVLSLRADHFDSRHLLGVVCLQRGEHAEALRHIDLALKLQPDNAVALNNRGVVLQELRRLHQALASFARAVGLRPDYAEAHANQGNALKALGRLAEALASYDRALALQPNHAEAHSNRADALLRLNRLEEALASYDLALALQPARAETHTNRGNALHDLCRFEDALTSYDRAIALRPDLAEAHSNRGNALQELNRFEEAMPSYQRAIALRPDFAEAYSNMGNAQKELDRLDQALASFEHAVTLRPDFADGHFNAAACLLLNGEFDRGWKEYEWRRHTGHLKTEQRVFTQPQWGGGEAIAGQTILIHAEQGFGDTLQFCRYIPRLAERAGRVIFEVQRPLVTLMAALAGSAQILARGDDLPQFDLHCPLLSLPLAFGTDLESIPAQTRYLAASEAKAAAWRQRFSRRNGPRVGLVWAGDPRKWLPNAHRIDRQRSVTFARLAPILQVPNCEFYSLQKGEHALAQLRDHPLRHHLTDWTDDLCDFSDTAALIEQLDLIIAVDTAVAHLAGALGKPFWLLNRYNTCWRWLLDRDDSPWYPTARLFRQDQSRDWDRVIAQAAAALQNYVQGTPALPSGADHETESA
jgi:tetratricopeptide (TPR) repeat protein